MPKPVYIVCANSIVQDKISNLVSIQGVIERLSVTVKQSGRGPDERPATLVTEAMQFWTIAVWRKVADDDEHEFKGQYVIIDPAGKDLSTPTTDFRFPAGDKFLFRMLMKFRIESAMSTGMLRVQARIRRGDHEDWLTQEYPIVVDVEELSDTDHDSAEVAQRTPAE